MKKIKRLFAISLIALSLSAAVCTAVSAACPVCTGPPSFADPDHQCGLQ